MQILAGHNSRTARKLYVKLLKIAPNTSGQGRSPVRPLRRVQVHVFADESINFASGFGRFLLATNVGEGGLPLLGVNRR